MIRPQPQDDLRRPGIYWFDTTKKEDFMLVNNVSLQIQVRTSCRKSVWTTFRKQNNKDRMVVMPNKELFRSSLRMENLNINHILINIG